MWERVVGRTDMIERLRRAATRPAHAYLIAGPAGSGATEAARCLAAALIGGEEDPVVADQVLRGVHPDVVEFEPGATQYRIDDDVRRRIIPEAMRAPVVAPRKVLIVREAERLRGNQNEPANALLKTLEEPPPRTVLILVTALADDLLPTIRSRCQRIDLEALSDEELTAALRADGVDEQAAALAVSIAGGQLARARALAGPQASLRAVFASIPSRVDGSGATAHALAFEAADALDGAGEAVAERQAAELVELDDRLEREGYEGRDAKRLRNQVEERHKREIRRTRMDLLLEGVTALESVYRDALVVGAARNTDRERLELAAPAVAAALDQCHAASEAFLVNEKGTLRLEHLAMALPVAG